MNTPLVARVLVPLLGISVATVEGLALCAWGRPYDWKAYWAALGNAVGRRLVHLLPMGIAATAITFVWEHRVASIVLPRCEAFVLLLLGVEFSYYWFHRASHGVRWLWATHVVHHAPNDLNFAVAYQLGWTDRVSGSVIFYLPLIWLGFAPAAVLEVLALNL